MTEFVKKSVISEAAAVAALVLEEPPSSTAFEHTGGRQEQTAELRDSHDNEHNHTNTTKKKKKPRCHTHTHTHTCRGILTLLQVIKFKYHKHPSKRKS